MTKKPLSLLRTLTLVIVASMALAVPHAGYAAAAKEAATPAAKDPTAPVDAKDSTDTAPKTALKDASPESKTTPPEKPMSADEKKAAIDAADAITAYDSTKEVGIAKPWQMYYQPAQSPVMEQIEPLHDAVLYIITAITILVLGLLIYICLKFNKRKNPKPETFTHNKTIEIIWTVIPILILVGIAIPSLRVHYKYYNNETIISNPDLTLKVVGHQWYWSYEYPDQGIAFDSNITPDKDIKDGEPRLLSVDNPIVVPVNKVVRVQLTSADVIHAWALPAFGVKKGAVPGRLNETWFKADKVGIYYGQCSVLCGKQHGFMPIKIVVVSDADFAAWVKGAKLKFASNDMMQFAALTHY